MASFEQNQQSQFNMNNSLDQVKQFQAELDKATTSIGAAELAAEEELQHKKLDNLITLQNEKLKKLKELTKLEEDRLYELADISLSLSEVQFEARKKEIQKELKLARDAMEELANEADKRKATKKLSGQTKSGSTTDDIAAASKASSASVTTEEQKNAAQPELIKVLGSLDSTLKALQKTVAAYGNQKPLVDDQISSNIAEPIDTQGGAGMESNSPAGSKQVESKEKENYFSADANLLEKVDIGHYSAEAVSSTFEGLSKNMSSTLTKLLGQVVANNGKDVSQDTTDFAGDLLKSYIDAIAAEEALSKLKQDNAEGELNRKLLFAEEEHRLREALAEEELKGIKANIKAKATIAFTEANRDKLLTKQKQDRENKYLEEYQEHLLKAGNYAVDFEKYRTDQEKKRHKNNRKDAYGKIREARSITGAKQAYGEYVGQRTKELNTFDKEAYAEKLKKRNPEMSDEDIKTKTAAAAKEAEAIAKVVANLELLAEAAGGLQAVLDADVKKIAEMQGFVDTRLQGSQINEQKGQSYWKQLLKDAKSIAGASPFIKQEKLVDNIKTLVDKGISFDVKQRAFLMTIQEKVANTFNAADGTLLRLIRIQQQDTTAGRLGMESALNSFLNSMYETSEYLENVASSVRSSLEEMQALMEGAAGTEVEYQVQKWMGSLYSVGMSDSAVQDIARTFGQIASGDVNGLTGSGTGNLLIMAANEAGMSIADILQDGLDATETNKLMQAMVNYLAEIAETSSDSRVVQQQLANVYGIRASDLKAATNLASSIKDVSKQNLTYSGMLGQLKDMMNTIDQRTSISEGMTNMWDNVMYSMASTQASNPILYTLPKMANLLRDVTGGSGIALPFVNVMGFGIDLNTSVADLMSIAAMAGTALGALGPALTGLSDLFDDSVGLSMLRRAGISTSGKAPVIARGSAPVLQNLGGSSISESGYIGNASGNDIKNATLQDAADSKKKQMVEAKDEESADDVATRANMAVVNIYNLLEEVAHGSQSLRVRLVNNAGGMVSFNGNDAVTPPTTPGAGVNSSDNGNWVLSF
jgi:hypothetical protein